MHWRDRAEAHSLQERNALDAVMGDRMPKKTGGCKLDPSPFVHKLPIAGTTIFPSTTSTT
jgi:hypothetical protein